MFKGALTLYRIAQTDVKRTKIVLSGGHLFLSGGKCLCSFTNYNQNAQKLEAYS
jgi:hypothetical protein